MISRKFKCETNIILTLIKDVDPDENPIKTWKTQKNYRTEG